MTRHSITMFIYAVILAVAALLLVFYMLENPGGVLDTIPYYRAMLTLIILALGTGTVVLMIESTPEKKSKDSGKSKSEGIEDSETPPRKSVADPDFVPFWEGHKIDYIVIAHSSDRAKTGSAVLRGVVGGAIGSAASVVTGGLAAPIGAAAGMMGAKRKGFLDLIIHYKNGKVETKPVKVNSREYRHLARYIRT